MSAPVVTPLAQPGAWSAVGERLPEPLHDVLVSHVLLGDEPSVDIGYRKPDGRWVLMGFDPELEIHPSHWMPLPALPEGSDCRSDCRSDFSPT